LDGVISILNDVGHFLPATVIGAIVLFAVKELIEASRRKKTNARKRQAVRRLIAYEIERNNWTLKNLRRNISSLKDSLEFSGLISSIRTGAHGERYLRSELMGELHSESTIGKVHSEVLSSSLLELAAIDEPIFSEALEAIDALKELDHVLKLMVDIVYNGGQFLEGYVEYATNEIADCEKTLSDFYKHITGREPKENRIR
jgi:hypothetical protein